MLAIRKFNQVVPDFGNETRYKSSCNGVTGRDLLNNFLLRYSAPYSPKDWRRAMNLRSLLAITASDKIFYCFSPDRFNNEPVAKYLAKSA
jgi:hypothetical protein